MVIEYYVLEADGVEKLARKAVLACGMAEVVIVQPTSDSIQTKFSGGGGRENMETVSERFEVRILV